MCDVRIFLLNDCYIIRNVLNLDSLFKFPEVSTVLNSGFLLVFQVTPAGYAHMTHLLNIVSGGKLLVILEGGSVLIS